jgi:membrane associated rhomboid family serine protease
VSGPATEPRSEERFALRSGRAVELFATGLSRPAGASQRFTPYTELLHLALGARALRIGTERGSIVLPRRAFIEPDAVYALTQRLRQQIAALPDGDRRQALQEALDHRQARQGRPWVGLALAALCAVFYVLSTRFPTLQTDGEYWRVFGLTHEPWRLVTAQLLHADPIHLLLNAAGLFVLGAWLERQTGAARTALVAAASAAGAMLGCALAGYESVVGASGVVMGLAGGLIALEMRRPDLLPALLRLPRGLLIGALALDFLLLSFVPNVAHAAHVGGLLAGGVAALALAPRDAAHFEAGAALRGGCAGALGLLLVALAAFGQGLADPGPTAARRGARLLEVESVPVLLLNNDAWTIATSREPTPEDLALALRLARRAVQATDFLDPNLLDTLAEVYFQLGRDDEALDTIEQAIALRPDEPYYEEQRLRFLGERAPDDRPAPPDPSRPPPGDEAPLPLEREPAEVPSIRV